MIHPWFNPKKTLKESAEKHLEIIKKFLLVEGRTERQRKLAIAESVAIIDWLNGRGQGYRVRRIVRDGGVPYEKYVEVD